MLGPAEVPLLSFVWLENGKLTYGEVPAAEAAEAELVSTLWSATTWRGSPPDEGMVHVLRNEGDEPAVGMAVRLSHPPEG